MALHDRSVLLSRMAAAAVVAALFAALTSATIAADVSPWDDDLQSAARLVAAQASNDGSRTLRAGLEIKLKPGWKTYWRYPGDSGVPPALDFSGAQNLKAVTGLYPAPQRFPVGAGGSSIGYTRNVIFPLHVVAQDGGRPVTLRVKLDYAVCEKLCVPAKAELELVLTGGASAQDAAIDAAEARVPRSAEIGGGGPLAIRAVHREAGAGKPRVVVDVAAPAGQMATLFAEGPTAQWALPLPEPVAGASAGSQRFAFALDGFPPGATVSGATLRLTAVTSDGAIEVAFRLD
jgi:DsbC/DsbD-like thiol-disulfide interchange protein